MPETTDDEIWEAFSVTYERMRLEAERMHEARKTCTHAEWDFAKHGRCCWNCGTFVVDFGD